MTDKDGPDDDDLTPVALPREDGAEPWPGYHADLDLQFGLVQSVIGEHGREVTTVGQLADLTAALPRDMSVTLEPDQAAGDGPYVVSIVAARMAAMVERHDEPAGPYPDGWDGFVPGLELTTVLLPEGHPVDQVPEQTTPAYVHDRAEQALEDGNIGDWLKLTASQLTTIAQQMSDEVAGWLPRHSDEAEQLTVEAQRLIHQAARLAALADPAQTAADS